MGRSEEWRVPDWFYEEWDDFNIWRPGEKDITEDILGRFIYCVDDAVDERPIQSMIGQMPQLMLGTQRTGHGTWVIPHQKLGSQFVTDFLIASGSSGGLDWELVELESPRAVPFIGNGEPSKELRKGISQIQEWRRWLESNVSYARLPKSGNGLGLSQIHSETMGTIIIGRRTKFPSNYNDIRDQFLRQNKIKIMSYDRLIELIATEMLRFRSSEDPSDCIQRLRLSRRD